jgi:large subunit ribosomal protein L10
MGMTRQAKEEAVASLSEKLSRARAGLIADFQGLDVETVTKIRAKFREAGVEYRVVKNTLMRRALEGTALAKLGDKFRGPKAVLFKYDEEYGQLGRVAKDLSKQYEKFKVQAGFVEKDIVEGQAGVETMAALPTLNEARAQLLGVINAPAAKLLATLNAPASHLLSVIEAKIEEDKKKDGAAAA